MPPNKNRKKTSSLSSHPDMLTARAVQPLNLTDFFPQLIEDLPNVAVGILSPELAILYLNRYGCHLLALPPESYQQTKWPDLIPASKRSDLKACLGPLQTGQSDEAQQIISCPPTAATVRPADLHFHYKAVTARDGLRYILVTIAVPPPLELATSPSECAVAEESGLSPASRTKKPQQASVFPFAPLFDASPIPIIIFNYATRQVINVNKSYLRLFHLTRQSAMQLKTFEIAKNLSPKRHLEIKDALAHNRPLYDQEIECIVPNGQKLHLSLYADTLFLQGEKCIFAMVEDISARKELEDRKNEFISMASHELKTPLTSAKAYVQLLQKQSHTTGDPQWTQYLQRIHIQINKISDLVNDMLDVTRIESDTLTLAPQQLNLTELIDEAITDMQCTTCQKIERVGQTAQLVHADRARITQVLVNFLSNALKYAPESEQIFVKIIDSPTHVTVGVQDFGPGIAPEQQTKVFERYFRTNHDSRPGVGLGLYISAEIIARHNGKIWVESEVGKGATFCFRLPIVTNKQG